MRLTALAIVIAIAVPLLLWASRRFERRQQERGRWDHRGPIDPIPRQPTDSELVYGVRFPRIEHEPLPADEADPPRER